MHTHSSIENIVVIGALIGMVLVAIGGTTFVARAVTGNGAMADKSHHIRAAVPSPASTWGVRPIKMAAAKEQGLK